jgi:hypothetical protein
LRAARAACFTALAFAFAPAAVRAAPGRAPSGFVPAGGAAVLRLDWAVVRADPLLRAAVKADELEKVFERVGVRGGEVSEAVIFLDIADPNRAGTAMILKGPRLRPALGELRSRGWGQAVSRGYRLHTEGAGGGCVAQLRSGFVVAGTRATVERVIAVESAGARSIVADEKFRLLSSHTSAAADPVSLLMIVPQEYADAGDVMVLAASILLDFAGLGPVGTLLDKVGLARGVGFSFGRGRGGVPLSLVALMRDERAAGLVSGTLTLLKGAASLMPARAEREADRHARQVFESMTVTRTRAAVSVRLTLPESEVFRP